MKRNVIVNKGSGGKNSMTLDLVDGGFVKSYGGMVAIGYKAGKREVFLSVTLSDLKEFIEDIEDRCKTAEKLGDGKCRGYQKSRVDDEPAEKCKECKDFELFGLE